MSKRSQGRFDLGEAKYIADTSALITLVASSAPTRTRNLTRLVEAGRLRVPEPVAREIRRREGKLKQWVDRHSPDCIQRATDDNIRDLADICRTYAHLLGEKAGAADPIVVCFARYFRQARWTVLTDDGGIQAVCLKEAIPCIPSAGFRRLESM
jgi:hypothetical protein